MGSALDALLQSSGDASAPASAASSDYSPMLQGEDLLRAEIHNWDVGGRQGPMPASISSAERIAAARAAQAQGRGMPSGGAATPLAQPSALDALLARSATPPSKFDMANGASLPADPALDEKASTAANQMRIQANDPGVGTTLLSQAAQGLTGNFSDEIMAGIKSGFGLAGNYDEALQHERDILQHGAEAHPVLSTAANVVGSLGSLAIPGLGEVGAVGRGAGLGAKIFAGAKVGGAYGAISGAGAADGGIGDRVQGAGQGLVAGGLTGGALPVAGTVIKNAAKPFVNAITARTNPSAYASAKIARSVGNLDRVQNKISRAAASGQNMSVADMGGDSARTLLRTAANVPGPGKAAINAKVNIAALGQGDRLRHIVGDTLADPNGYQDAKAAVMDARSHAATPYYNQAYARPVPFTHELESVLQTPAGRAGLAAARTNALNRREPWAQWFANVSDDGRIIDIRRVPDTRALDEVQRVIAVQERAAMRPADGSPFARMIDTPASIAIRNAHQALLREIDRYNPAFARARQEGLDNIQADQALEFGRGALTNDARVNARRMGLGGAGRDQVLTPGQQEIARIGAAEAVRAKIDAAGWTHNAILTFFKSSESARRLRPFFRTQEEWNTFRRAIYNEARKAKTTNAVRGNSTTAAQLADMADGGNIDQVVGTTRQLARGNIIEPAIAAVVGAIRRLGGLTPEVAAEVGRQLMTRDPAQVGQIVSQIRGIEQRGLSRSETANRIRRVLTALVASREGTQLAPQPSGRLVAQ